MATPYKRVKILKDTTIDGTDYKAGATIDVASDTAEQLVITKAASLLGAGNPPEARPTADKKPGKS